MVVFLKRKSLSIQYQKVFVSHNEARSCYVTLPFLLTEYALKRDGNVRDFVLAHIILALSRVEAKELSVKLINNNNYLFI